MKQSKNKRLLATNTSPPAWGRGLKHRFGEYGQYPWSPPAWGRGLKPWEIGTDTLNASRPPRGGVD